MKTWTRALRDAAIAGNIAGLASAAALVVCGRRDTGHHCAALNAPSQWLWGRKALRQNHASARFTGTGILVHQASAVFWSLVHEKALSRLTGAGAHQAMYAAALTTALAAWVDLRVVPERLTPGFNRRLTPGSLLAVYALFGVGLAVTSHLLNARDAQRDTTVRDAARYG